ncbi:LssY C-terminal domain-containing protein [Candidatus Saccharibacteria bacterium]|nr:LssY C-terminal domain-containing protein [Candidatus Saccharibacteria bacterium]
MVHFVLRYLWRLIILVLGIGALYFIVTTLWPESNNRFAVFAALLGTYCLMAYLVIPNLMRLFHVFSKPDRIPLYASTGDGWPSDPVNIAIVTKNRKQLVTAFKKAGWHQSDPLTIRNGWREIVSIIFNTRYPAAPLSNLYLFDRPHDVGFALPTNNKGSARTRHHVRFWRLEEPIKQTRHGFFHYDFWHTKVRHALRLNREIWIGAATEDIRFIDVQWRTGQLTHGVSHEAEKERDFVIASLQNRKLVKRIQSSEAGEEFRFRGQSFRTFYTTDGSIKIVHLINNS